MVLVLVHVVVVYRRRLVVQVLVQWTLLVAVVHRLHVRVHLTHEHSVTTVVVLMTLLVVPVIVVPGKVTVVVLVVARIAEAT